MSFAIGGERETSAPADDIVFKMFYFTDCQLAFINVGKSCNFRYKCFLVSIHSANYPHAQGQMLKVCSVLTPFPVHIRWYSSLARVCVVGVFYL